MQYARSMSEKITGVCIDIPILIDYAKKQRAIENKIPGYRCGLPGMSPPNDSEKLAEIRERLERLMTIPSVRDQLDYLKEKGD